MSRKGILRIRFAPGLSVERQESLRQALSTEPGEAESFDGYRRGVKRFYRVESAEGPVFLKVRQFRGWARRIGNTLRRTKDEREFENLLALGRLGVPCPAPLAVARLGRLLTAETRLALAFVEARPLQRLLLESEAAERAVVLDRLVAFLGLLRERGVVHEDLHWSNLLIRKGAGGPEFLLIDPLHVRLLGRPADEEFEPCLDWLLAFAMYQQCPREIVGELLERLKPLRRPGSAGAEEQLARSRRSAEALAMREERKKLVPSPLRP